MNSKLRLTILGGALFCLLLAVASADSCVKSLYVNGVQEGAASATAVLSREYDRLTIGANGNYQNLTEGLYGQIDEFAIYAGVLSEARIQAHASYNPGDANYVTAVLADNPLLYFQFEDATSSNGDPVNNTGSVARDGTYIGDANAEPNLVAGYIGQAVELYGYVDGNATCIDVNDYDDAFFPADGDVTIEFWAKVPAAPNNTQWWFQHTNTWGQNGYGANVVYYLATDYYYNFIRGGGSTSPIEANTCEQWKHIVFTYDSSVTVPFQDYYDQVMQDDPCLYLRFEDFNDPCDASGHDYWVEYGSRATIGPEGGGIGNCIYLPGAANSYAAAANQSTEPNSTAPEFGHQFGFAPGDTTFEFWYRSNSEALPIDGATFFNQSYQGGEAYIVSPVYEMWNMVTGQYTYSRYSYNHPGGGWGYANQSGAMQIPLDDAWHHIVFSWEEKVGDVNRMNFRLCIDGIAVKSATYGDTSPEAGIVGGNRGEMDHIVIGSGGWRNALAGGRLVGYVDEFAIYSGVLPIQRVVAHYEAGLPKNCQELWDRGLVSVETPWAIIVDKDKNCNIDFYDFAAFASGWALCNDPNGGAGCVPNW